MWGVSWSNVNLMMADAQKTDYDRDNDSKVSNGNRQDNDVLDLSDPKNIEILKKMAQ